MGRVSFKATRTGLATIVSLGISCFASGQMTTNVLRRTFLIKYGDVTGTAFTIDVDERQYLVTAKHVLVGLKDGESFDVRRGDSWIPLKTVKVLNCKGPIDIVVVVPSEQISVAFELKPTVEGMGYGQEVFFVGYPYGLFTDAKAVNGPFPMAFVKRATFSASKNDGGVMLDFFDGHNNGGFSGGPVVFRDFRHSDYVLNVASVVSGYAAEYMPVLLKKEIKESDITPDDIRKNRVIKDKGKVYRLEDTDDVVPENTGIVQAYSIKHAVDIIKDNPIGPKIAPDFVEWPSKPSRTALGPKLGPIRNDFVTCTWG